MIDAVEFAEGPSKIPACEWKDIFPRVYNGISEDRIFANAAGAFAAILWLVAYALFSWYAANFGNFNKTYGSLGAVMGFMTWMWLLIIVVLVGAKLNAEVEHQTMGEAKMADTTGPS